MATQTQIINLRLAINDPDCIDIIQVSTTNLLPAVPAQQSVYYVVDIGHYVATDIETGASPADYKQVKLYLSDGLLGALIDRYGADKAICYAYGKIIPKIGAELPLEENQTGTERAKFVTLTAKYNYYKKLYDECFAKYNKDHGNGTGQFLATKAQVIAGGQV
jgi:hypothetical protein